MVKEMKSVIDWSAIGTMLGAWISVLPDVAAFLSIVWFALRIWESETVKRMTGRWSDELADKSIR